MNKRNSGIVLSSSQQKLLFSMEEAAELMSIGRTVFYDLVMRKEIASVKIGRSRRVPLRALEDYVARQLVEKQSA